MKNLNRWHGTRPNTSAAFDFDGSVLKRYLQTAKIKVDVLLNTDPEMSEGLPSNMFRLGNIQERHAASRF